MPIENLRLRNREPYKGFYRDYRSWESRRSRYQSVRVITEALSSTIITILGYSLTAFEDEISLNATRAINLVILSIPVIVAGLERFYSRQINMLNQHITENKNYAYAKGLFLRAEDVKGKEKGIERQTDLSNPTDRYGVSDDSEDYENSDSSDDSASSDDSSSSDTFYDEYECDEQAESTSIATAATRPANNNVLDLSRLFSKVGKNFSKEIKRLEKLLDSESKKETPRPIQEIFEDFVKNKEGGALVEEFKKAAEYVGRKFAARVDLDFDEKDGKIVTKGIIHTIELYKNLKSIDLRNGIDNVLKSIAGMMVTVLGFVVFAISMEASGKRTSKDMTRETDTQRSVEIINFVIAATPMFFGTLIALRAAWAKFCFSRLVPKCCDGPKETSLEDAVKNLKKTAYESNLLKNPLAEDAVGSMTRAFSP